MRTFENIAGVTFDKDKKTVIYAEDMNAIAENFNNNAVKITLNPAICPDSYLYVTGKVSTINQLPDPKKYKGDIFAISDDSLYKSNGRKWTYINGTGSLSDILSLPVTVIEPTGVNDHIAINNAIISAGNAGGGIIELVEGLYIINNPIISRKNNVYIKGAGIDKTIVRCSATFTTLVTTAPIGFVPDSANLLNYGVFGGLTIDKRTNNIFCNGIEARKPSTSSPWILKNGFFSAVKVLSSGSYSNGSYESWGYGVNGFSMFGLDIDGNEATALISTELTDHQGLEIYGGTDCFLFNNTVKNIGNIGILLQTIISETKHSIINCHAFNNTIEAVKRGVVTTATFDATNKNGNLIDVFVHDNIFTKISQHGLWLSSSSGDLVNPPLISNVHFYKNNFTFREKDDGAYTDANALLLSNYEATSNEFIYHDITVKNNKFYGCTPQGTSAIVRFSKVKNIEISGNSFETLSSEFGSFNVVGLLAIQCANLNISDNYINGSRLYGVQLQRCINIKLHNNTIKNYNLYAGGVSGIYIDGTTDGNHFIDIQNNKLETSVQTSIGRHINFGNSNNEFISHANNEYIGDIAMVGNLFDNINGAVQVLQSTNPHPKQFTMGGATSVTLADLEISANSIIELVKVSGSTAIDIVSIVPTDGSVTITFSGANSSKYFYRVINNY